MTAELSPRERWERAAGELRAFRDLQRQTWGEIDNAILGRYLAGEVTAVERELVEATLQRHPDLRELLALIGEALPIEVPQSAAAPDLQPPVEDLQVPGPALAGDPAPEHAGRAALRELLALFPVLHPPPDLQSAVAFTDALAPEHAGTAAL